MKILVIVVVMVLLLVLGYGLFVRKTHDMPNPISKSDPRYAAIARVVADDLSELKTTNGESVDSRPNVGGIFYGVTAPEATKEGQYIVPLVLHPVVPPSAPRYFEEPSGFSYVVAEQEDGTFTIVERPDPDALQNFYLELVATLAASEPAPTPQPITNEVAWAHITAAIYMDIAEQHGKLRIRLDDANAQFLVDRKNATQADTFFSVPIALQLSTTGEIRTTNIIYTAIFRDEKALLARKPSTEELIAAVDALQTAYQQLLEKRQADESTPTPQPVVNEKTWRELVAVITADLVAKNIGELGDTLAEFDSEYRLDFAAATHTENVYVVPLQLYQSESNMLHDTTLMYTAVFNTETNTFALAHTPTVEQLTKEIELVPQV